MAPSVDPRRARYPRHARDPVGLALAHRQGGTREGRASPRGPPQGVVVELTDPARELRRLRTELRRAEEEVARLTELLAGRDQEIRVLREKLAAKGLNVRTT